MSGKGPLRISLEHVLPNILSIIIVQATTAFAVAILAEAALSYLGLGTQPPHPSWGRMLNEAQTFLYQAPRLASWIDDHRIHGPKIVVGDFNEWGRGLVSDVLATRLQSLDLFKHLKRRRTYPGVFPFLHLDHIYFSGNIEIRKIALPRTRLSLIASDHLPLVADIRVGY